MTHRPVPEPPASLATALAARYTIERALARGSFAVIYLAQDRKHDRRVVVKVLVAELASVAQAGRFLREIEVAARLTHPRIVPLYDSGSAEGLTYYVMPYIDGPSLRERLETEPRLEIGEALRIAADVAAALDFAHQHGVVHRDIKPENILLAGDEALVADFGIARAVAVAAGDKLTQTGMTVGTPGYMSPEQVYGRRDLDGRADVYSLGCVLYEMLAHHPPFIAGTVQEMLARHVLDPVPAIRAARPDVPVAVERAVLRALAKKAADRFATAAQFAAALRGEPAATPAQGSGGVGTMWRALRLTLARMRRSSSG